MQNKSASRSKVPFRVILNRLVVNLKGILMALITFFDIILYRRCGYSLLSKIKSRKTSFTPSPPESVAISFTPNRAPVFVPLTQKGAAKQDPDPHRYWIQGNFHTPYNLTVNLSLFLAIKYNLKILGINEQDCRLLSFSPRMIMPYPSAEIGREQLIKHFGKFSPGREMSGCYRLNKFVRIKNPLIWTLWADTNLAKELRQDILTSYDIVPAPPVKKVTRVLLVSRGPAYFHKTNNITIRRIFNE